MHYSFEKKLPASSFQPLKKNAKFKFDVLSLMFYENLEHRTLNSVTS